MKFNWDEFKKSNEIAVHCKTKKEAIDFCEKMNEHGLTRLDGTKYLNETRWDYYKDEMCYYSDGYFGNCTHAHGNEHTILEWENYMCPEISIDELITKLPMQRTMSMCLTKEYLDGYNQCLNDVIQILNEFKNELD